MDALGIPDREAALAVAREMDLQGFPRPSGELRTMVDDLVTIGDAEVAEVSVGTTPGGTPILAPDPRTLPIEDPWGRERVGTAIDGSPLWGDPVVSGDAGLPAAFSQAAKGVVPPVPSGLTEDGRRRWRSEMLSRAMSDSSRAQEWVAAAEAV